METEASIRPMTVVGILMKFVFLLYAAHAKLDAVLSESALEWLKTNVKAAYLPGC